MSTVRATSELEEIRGLFRPLEHPDDLGPLIERAGAARLVLLGEASHGTSEFYRWRAEITRRLIVEHGFDLVAVEGDWPDCFEVHRWINADADGGGGDERTAAEVLGRFDRWPTWMWANEEVAEFATWLRGHRRHTGTTVGFYGLDVYSLWESLERVLGHLGHHHPDALAAASQAARCFEPYREDPQRYALATRVVPHSCLDEVVEVLTEARRVSGGARASDGRLDLLQNAEVLAGAERYYRAMMGGDAESWNVRDRHMADTLDRVVEHHGPGAKAIVWEHNTHVGDARATDMAWSGMVNVGQLARERHGEDAVLLVGFGGYDGTVLAAPRWGAPMRRMPVPEAVRWSHEALIHEVVPDAALALFPDDRSGPWLSARRGHRAIGVVYEPERDRAGNWVPTVMGRRYDAFLSFGTTSALHPLHPFETGSGEMDTYPWGS